METPVKIMKPINLASHSAQFAITYKEMDIFKQNMCKDHFIAR